ncbi:MAG: biotin--[acetyl-CoA-carboxylase] ligase [Chloroflexota bacterium]|nr:biotin--[acetyl-CoA-carboxylase] ligase [Chloroflexota bacterium]
MSTSEFSHYRRADGWLGRRFLYLERTTSTSEVLRQLAEEGAAEGLVILADEQTAGRGRLARRWEALPGDSLLFSLLFRPPEPFAYHATRTTMLCGLALRQAVALGAGLTTSLKWPNDLIIERAGDWRKLAGMLSEIGMTGGRPAFLIVGIGLNVNIPVESLSRLAPNATSLLAEIGHDVGRVALLDTFLQRTEALVERQRAGWDPLAQWRAGLAWRGRTVQVHLPTETLAGVAEDVDAEGALLLRLPDGSRRRFPAGDVSLRL